MNGAFEFISKALFMKRLHLPLCKQSMYFFSYSLVVSINNTESLGGEVQPILHASKTIVGVL